MHRETPNLGGEKEGAEGKEVGENHGICPIEKASLCSRDSPLKGKKKKKKIKAKSTSWEKPRLGETSTVPSIPPGFSRALSDLQVVVRGPEGVTLNMRRKIIIIRDEARVRANFFERGNSREKDPMCLPATQKFPGRRSTAGGTLRGPGPCGAGKRGGCAGLYPPPGCESPGLDAYEV